MLVLELDCLVLGLVLVLGLRDMCWPWPCESGTC